MNRQKLEPRTSFTLPGIWLAPATVKLVRGGTDWE